MLAIAPADIQYHDSYFVVAHFHYVLVPGSIFALMAAAYYWLPKWTGHMYNETLGKWHFWLSTIFVNLTFFPMHFLGLAGMPRRIPDYSTQFATSTEMASIGAIGFGLSQLIFVYVMLTCKKRRESNGSRLGGAARSRVDGTVAGAVSHVRYAAGQARSRGGLRVTEAGDRRTAPQAFAARRSFSWRSRSRSMSALS